MVYICTAVYAEAQPFIKKLNLKKDLKLNQFQVFKNDDIVLIITGVGKIKAAVAVTFLLINYKPNAKDILINIGVCGANEEASIGNIYVCNKIFDYDTKNTFYPDMLIKQPFEETSIETCPFVVKNGKINLNGKLFDMEAVGIYQAALVFMETHQVVIIKIVSDILNNSDANNSKVLTANIKELNKIDNSTKLNDNYISNLIENNAGKIISFINQLKVGVLEEYSMFSKEEYSTIIRITNNLKLSVAMKNKLRQSLFYYKLQNHSIMDFLSTYVNVECQTKIEGKKLFAEIQRKLI